jgi:multiple sugar transport system permease protein
VARPSVATISTEQTMQTKQSRVRLQTRRTITAYLLLAIPLLFFLSVRIYPTLQALSMSFSVQTGHGFTLENYRTLFQDPVFWRAAGNTLMYVVITVPLQMGLGLLLAIGIERVKRFRSFYRMIYFLPYITSIVAVSWVWRLMYDPNTGFINMFLVWLHMHPQQWLNSPSEALLSVSFVMIWQTAGFTMLIYMAGIEAIPRHFYEAAEIDGASSWKSFCHITWPLLNPTTVFLAVTGVISALQTFTQIENLTGSSNSEAGGPLNSTVSMVVYMYNSAFQNFNLQYASAITVALFIIILLVTLVQLRVLNRSFEY